MHAGLHKSIARLALCGGAFAAATGPALAVIDYEPGLYTTDIARTIVVEGCTRDRVSVGMSYTIYPHVPTWNARTTPLAPDQKISFADRYYNDAAHIIHRHSVWKETTAQIPSDMIAQGDPHLVGHMVASLDLLRVAIEDKTGIPTLLGIGPVMLDHDACNTAAPPQSTPDERKPK